MMQRKKSVGESRDDCLRVMLFDGRGQWIRRLEI